MTLGTWGHIQRTEIEPGRWYADCWVRDLDGITRRARRHTPTGVVDRKGAAAERVLIDHLKNRIFATSDDEEITRDTTVATLWKNYRAHLVELGRASNTLQRYDHVAKIIIKGLGGVRLGEVTTQRLERFIRTVESNQGAADAKTCRTVLTGMCGMGVRFDVWSENPVRETRSVDTTPSRTTQALEPEQLRQLLHDVQESDAPCPALPTGKDSESAGEQRKSKKQYRIPTVAEYCRKADLADLITMFTATGVRMAELLAFLPENFDPETKTIEVTGHIVRIPKVGLRRLTNDYDPKMPKNKRRTLALPDYAVVMLQRRIAELQSDDDDATRPDTDTDEHVQTLFPSSTGTLRDPTNVNDQWRRVRAALGVGDITGHSFRKTVATLIDDAEMSARVAADQLGHAQVSMTQDVYMKRGTVRFEVAGILDSVINSGDKVETRPKKKTQASR
ncbi:tyrosine recombinase XerC [Nocardia terpenica]|uniref:Tyr recombinase domain-containing protein n=1 Tax=Nocardia terpenica TaxID=455432 RepID=A0A164KPS3_9NOCA|nr:tyrosine-type recombinase/integrase [Nocardia terpenica]KZM71609.1 hypothetical protein AWN90_02475 [Nocardia terpenica]NQE90826.1 tyrosine-type recombinase/integrase [Nocardia terpenica]